tara:strand:- start:22 stop:417 length:396 start_codon:yes stop_codon:yes gene_type:complete
VAGAIQTQILGFSAGTTVVDKNCERIKLSRSLYDMGMKVAAVSMMCQDERVWDAMRMAGTPCPYEGMIGEDAAEAWKNNPNRAPKGSMAEVAEEDWKQMGSDNETKYKVWRKDVFCDKFPDEETCDSESDE